MSDEQDRALREAAEELSRRVRESEDGSVWTMRNEDDDFVVEGPDAPAGLVRRFIYEGFHYFVAIGAASIGLGVYLELESTSPDKHTFAALAFAYGACWIGIPIWSLVVKPRLKM